MNYAKELAQDQLILTNKSDIKILSDRVAKQDYKIGELEEENKRLSRVVDNLFLKIDEWEKRKTLGGLKTLFINWIQRVKSWLKNLFQRMRD